MKTLDLGDYGGAQVPHANQLLGHAVWVQWQEFLKNGMWDGLFVSGLGKSATWRGCWEMEEVMPATPPSTEPERWKEPGECYFSCC